MIKNRFLILFVFVFAGIFVLSVLVGALNNNQKVQSPNLMSFPRETREDYNNFNKLLPGSSTIGDLKKVNGDPIRSQKIQDKEFLYYPAPFGNENPVLVKNEIVIYTSEYIFGDYRGDFAKYKNAFQDPDKILYDQRGLAWKVFFKEGLAILESANEISRIIYFVPNNVSLFYETVFKDFSFSENPVGITN